MATEFLVDGELSGTGIRDAINGGYVRLEKLGLSEPLIEALSSWQAQYEDAHFKGFPPELIADLDKKGVDLSRQVGSELTDFSVGYYSHGLLKRLA